MSVRARAFVYTYITAGAVATALVLSQWNCTSYARLATLIVLGLLGSLIKFRIPGVHGTVTVGLIVVLIGIVELSPAEALAIGLAAGIFQMYWKAARKPSAAQILFNLSSFGVSVGATASMYQLLSTRASFLGAPAILVLTGAIYFLLNAVPVAIVLSLTHGSELVVWRIQYGWMILIYVSGSCLAGGLHYVTGTYGWQAELLVLPILFTFGRTYQVFLGRMEDSHRHADELQALQLRSIHTLALAVEAKDENTHAHLHRVRSYATALARDLGVTGDDLKALDAAAILHDIGKLAVPEHIIAKPGKLTAEEFDRMKVHTVVGSTIVEGMEFPYQVAPLVRAHHEKWDGSGYPDGLIGEAIPMGARILSAVDCLDALASDRPYRRALPLDLAMKIVRSQAGKSYDPQVVDVLERKYVELEVEARLSLATARNGLPTNIRISRGAEPATGLEVSAANVPPAGGSDPDPIGRLQAVLSVQAAIEELANASRGLSTDQLARSLSALVQSVLPHDALVLFELRPDDVLEPRAVHGIDADLLEQTRIPLRQGLAGWVAHHREPIVNGDPAVEYGADIWSRPAALMAALAVPLSSPARLVGVAALYRLAKDSFSRTELKTLELLAFRLSECVAKGDEKSDWNDFLKGLERAVAEDQSPAVLIRLEVEGCLSPAAAFGIIHELFPEQALMLELRRSQFVVLVNSELAPKLGNAAREILAKHGAQLHVGWAMVEQGLPVEHLLAAAERALMDSKQQAMLPQQAVAAQNLIGLHAALTGADAPVREISAK